MILSWPTEAWRKHGYGKNRKIVVLPYSLLSSRARPVCGLSWTVEGSVGTQVFLLMMEMLLKRGNTLPGNLPNLLICQLTVWCWEKREGKNL